MPLSAFWLIFLVCSWLATGHLLNQLVADGFNNVSDIVGNVALLIGIRLARQPRRWRCHRFGHWKIEDGKVSSLPSSCFTLALMFEHHPYSAGWAVIVFGATLESSLPSSCSPFISTMPIWASSLNLRRPSGWVYCVSRCCSFTLGTSIAILASSSFNYPYNW